MLNAAHLARGALDGGDRHRIQIQRGRVSVIMIIVAFLLILPHLWLFA